jgi:hypothetical protein
MGVSSKASPDTNTTLPSVTLNKKAAEGDFYYTRYTHANSVCTQESTQENQGILWFFAERIEDAARQKTEK